jgi:branched-chain amino acid transport system permease protein
MSSLAKFNLRDRFGDWWDGSSPIQRAIFRVILIAIFFGLPFLKNPIIDTPNTSFESVLFYPLVMFAVMALGLNVVVGKSGILDLGYVAFFAIGAYTQALFGLHTDLNFWIVLLLGMAFAMFAGILYGETI